MLHLLEVVGISKCFGSFWANKNISFYLNHGEILSLLGENGAGKTTLMNILYGLYKPTSGTIYVDGKECRILRPKDAIDLGISMVHQHFMLVDSLSVTENIVLGKEPKNGPFIDLIVAQKKVQEISLKYGLEIDPSAIVGTLSVGQKQRVELLKALYNDCSILILDEPTAVLTPLEVESFFKVLDNLRNSGKGVILISHKLIESISIADRIYVMRLGEFVAETKPSETNIKELSELMVGRPMESPVKNFIPSDGPIRFQFENICYEFNGIKKLENINLSCKSGRILGIAGVDGNGQTELIEAAIGVINPSSGCIFFNDEEISSWPVKKRISNGISYIPEDRQKKGLVTSFSIEENLILGYEDDKRFLNYSFISWKKINTYADKTIKKYDIRCRNKFDIVASLSGGNQQKIVIGRAFEADPDVIIASQPTRGVDIGAVEYIHSQLIEMKKAGKAILLISADLDEIIKLSDDIAVIYEGRIVCVCPNAYYSKTELGQFMIGASMGGMNEK